MRNQPTSLNSSGKEQGKDTNKKQTLKPQFLDLNDPVNIVNHVEGLIKENSPPCHEIIVDALMEHIEPIDFMAIVHPEVVKLRAQLKDSSKGEEEKESIRKALRSYKLQQKHYIVVSIDELRKYAENNSWGLCKNKDTIFLYNGEYWGVLDKEMFQGFLGKAAEKMSVPVYDARYYQVHEKLFKQFMSTSYLPAPNVDPNTVLINLQNGTYEIMYGQMRLREFKREDFLTYQLPFEFDERATAPQFHEYLNKVLPDESAQMVLAEYLGSLFIRNGNKIMKQEKALVLFGPGANGKSVMFHVVEAVLGSTNVSNFSLQSLTNESGYYRAMLGHTLVNYTSEMNGRLDTSYFKQLVSGEPVEARLPYGQPLTITQYGKLIFNCNELPRDVEHTPAYFRRFIILPFEVIIPPEQQDKSLHITIIEKELPGVFNWILNGLRRILENGHFTHCKSAESVVKRYEIESSSIKMFFEDEGYQICLENEMLLGDVYREYDDYCIYNGMKPFSRINFSRQLQLLGAKKGRQGGSGKTVISVKKI